jgi:hypothetical protein
MRYSVRHHARRHHRAAADAGHAAARRRRLPGAVPAMPRRTRHVAPQCHRPGHAALAGTAGAHDAALETRGDLLDRQQRHQDERHAGMALPARRGRHVGGHGAGHAPARPCRPRITQPWSALHRTCPEGAAGQARTERPIATSVQSAASWPSRSMPASPATGFPASSADRSGSGRRSRATKRTSTWPDYLPNTPANLAWWLRATHRVKPQFGDAGTGCVGTGRRRYHGLPARRRLAQLKP